MKTGCSSPSVIPGSFAAAGLRVGTFGVLLRAVTCWVLFAWAGLTSRFPSVLRAAVVLAPPQRVRRWAVASVAVAGTFHAVSGATAPSISSPLDVQVQVGTPFSYRISINQVWLINSFDAAPLPPGLVINRKLGVITGKPTQVGTNSVRITASQDNLPDRTLSGLLNLRVTAVPAPPLFSLDPTNIVALSGQDVTFVSEALGTGTLRYQWYFGFGLRGQVSRGDPIPGATNATLLLRKVTEKDLAYYISSASNSAGVTFSQPGLLSLILKPTLYYQSESQTVHERASTALYVSADGGAELNYQWRKDAVPIPGETNSLIYFAFVARTDAGSYDVLMDNVAGHLVSHAAVLTVVDPFQVHMSQKTPRTAALQFNSIPGATYSITYLDRLDVDPVAWQWFYLMDFLATGTNSTVNGLSGGSMRFFQVRPD